MAGQHGLELAQAPQVGLDFLQGVDIEELADIGHVLQHPAGLVVGELLDFPGGDDQILVELAAGHLERFLAHEVHQLLAFLGDDDVGVRYGLLPCDSGAISYFCYSTTSCM
ncbi:MAG: hypothetical protein VYA71_01870 [Pseudomonadota bacterium]|nr:hypothetical protein [Pseudomonadota bacterium]